MEKDNAKQSPDNCMQIYFQFTIYLTLMAHISLSLFVGHFLLLNDSLLIAFFCFYSMRYTLKHVTRRFYKSLCQ